MSGHSKWSTIKRKKGAADVQKGKLFGKISRMISVAIKEKGLLPELNPGLRLALEKAKEANMPAENVQRIMKKWSGEGGEKIETVQFEGYGPGGIAVIIDAVTDSRNRTSQEMRHVLSEYGGNLASPGSVMWMFERCGRIVVPRAGTSFEDIEALAIEGGAHDIQQEDGAAVIITKPDELFHVKTFFEGKGIVPERAELDYQPKNTVAVADPAMKERVEAFLEALDANDDVQDIYSNVEFL